MPIEVTGKHGGRIKVMQKGDPSPNKGKTKAAKLAAAAANNPIARDCAALNKQWTHLPPIAKEAYYTLLAKDIDLPIPRLRELIADDTLPGWIRIEVSSWLDPDKGADNYRKAFERLFGKPTEWTGTTENNNDWSKEEAQTVMHTIIASMGYTKLETP